MTKEVSRQTHVANRINHVPLRMKLRWTANEPQLLQLLAGETEANVVHMNQL